jgi:hypothetical protein
MMGTLQFNNTLHSKLLGDIQGINLISTYGANNYLELLSFLSSNGYRGEIGLPSEHLVFFLLLVRCCW